MTRDCSEMYELRLSGNSLKAATSESRTFLTWPQTEANSKLLAYLDQLYQYYGIDINIPKRAVTNNTDAYTSMCMEDLSSLGYSASEVTFSTDKGKFDSKWQ